MNILRIALALIAGAVVATMIALAATRPAALPADTESAARLEPGPWSVDLAEHVWVDISRPTAPNGDFAGAPEREFEVALWAPLDTPGPHPLLVYSHGFMSNRHEGRYLGEHLASHGYVVVAADFPLSSYDAPGGPSSEDVIHQPADVSFLIDRALALRPQERAFDGDIDRDRIGVLGVSLGGLTSTLVAFHRELRDPRLRAAISIAGPSVMFGPIFFDQAQLPFLMIAGTHDAMIPYELNAEPLPSRIREGGLITLDGASHAGFSHLMSGPMRLLGNPDELGCRAISLNLQIEDDTNPFEALGGPEQGMLDARGTQMPCEIRFEEAMPAGRQHWLTTLAVRAFLESHFAATPALRRDHEIFLTETFPREIAEIHYTPAQAPREASSRLRASTAAPEGPNPLRGR